MVAIFILYEWILTWLVGYMAAIFNHESVSAFSVFYHQISLMTEIRLMRKTEITYKAYFILIHHRSVPKWNISLYRKCVLMSTSPYYTTLFQK